jgi:hypothetical protein
MRRTERNGLRVVPTFDEAVLEKPHKISLPAWPYTKFYESPAYQSLLNQQQQIETNEELNVRRAELQGLMGRLAREARVPVAHVRAMVHGAARAGMGGGGEPPPPGERTTGHRRQGQAPRRSPSAST